MLGVDAASVAGSTVMPQTGSLTTGSRLSPAPPAVVVSSIKVSAAIQRAYTQQGYIGIPPAGIHGDRGGDALTEDNKPKLLNRLSRIEGQVRGVARMVEERPLLHRRPDPAPGGARRRWPGSKPSCCKGHLDHCIESAIVSGDQAEQRRKASELIELLERTAR